jgi:hypothetical protein
LLFDLSKVVYLFQRIIQYEQSILDIPESWNRRTRSALSRS